MSIKNASFTRQQLMPEIMKHEGSIFYRMVGYQMRLKRSATNFVQNIDKIYLRRRGRLDITLSTAVDLLGQSIDLTRWCSKLCGHWFNIIYSSINKEGI